MPRTKDLPDADAVTANAQQGKTIEASRQTYYFQITKSVKTNHETAPRGAWGRRAATGWAVTNLPLTCLFGVVLEMAFDFHYGEEFAFRTCKDAQMPKTVGVYKSPAQKVINFLRKGRDRLRAKRNQRGLA